VKRIDRLLALALQSGSLTSYVQSKINGLPKEPGKFKKEFLKMKPGPDRTKLVVNDVLSKGKPKDLAPVTIEGPDGTKLTYFVTKDYVKGSDGQRVAVDGVSAEKIAQEFDMILPTYKMVNSIFNAADAKILTPPLSSGAWINGKWYSGEEVVRSKINSSDAIVQYNDDLDKALEKYPKFNLLGGARKEIVQSTDPNKLGIYGLFNGDKGPIQGGIGASPHPSQGHEEYALGLRLVSPDAVITKSDGTTVKVKLEDVAKDPVLGKLVSDTGGFTRYNTK